MGLYVHLPWCVQKCPYCDFNSYSLRGRTWDSDRYVQHVVADLAAEAERWQHHTLHSVFFGGGTPSLCPPDGIAAILEAARQHFSWVDEAPHATTAEVEVTLEANPGAAEHGHLHGFHAAGVNRLSIGAQSFNEAHLKVLGRIHDPQAIACTFAAARDAGFQRINCDIMYALPHQTLEHAMDDLDQAMALQPDHIAWYHLTLEPNTAFYRRPPPLPDHDMAADIMDAGRARLAAQGFERYEVSAYAQPGQASVHNLGYWHYQDYLGVGAGAHSKWTGPDGTVERSWRHAHPKRYTQERPDQVIAGHRVVNVANQRFEFMMNRLRCWPSMFTWGEAGAATHTDAKAFKTWAEGCLMPASQHHWVRLNEQGLEVTSSGFDHLDTLVAACLPAEVNDATSL